MAGTRKRSLRSSVKRPLASEAISALKESARGGGLVAIIGSGVSLALTNGKVPALSWRGLILDGFAHGVTKGIITPGQERNWKAQLDSSDLDDLLGAAEFVGRKLGAPNGDLYARWLQNTFSSVRSSNKELQNAISALRCAGARLCTLNYDSLLESVTGLPGVTLNETARVSAWMRGEPGILHLHGLWTDPPSCILGIRDYERTLGNEVRDLVQRNLGSFNRLFFIGCGNTFADPNFSALVRWLREKMGTAAPQHYAAVKNCEVESRNADPAWRGFVEPLGYGRDHEHLAAFLTKHFPPTVKETAGRQAGTRRVRPATSSCAKLIRNYCSFLIKDCGQMTIEGVRADMDTAQRRFDLERLFVPLQVVPTPPDIPEADPQREQKLLEWQRKNGNPIPFGKVIRRRKRVALLALPGGGKSLLLKRLAVAYADPVRRQATADALPDLDVIPVLIRCREWREHIHRPIATLLKNISDITGDTSLVGLSDALEPLFKKGHVLLLVDGLDEIHDGARRAAFVNNLERFMQEYERTRLIVTSREAGFALVAPSLARFCERWRIAPLNEESITLLCGHWHQLMTGESPQAKEEAQQIAGVLLRNLSLRRLAENPLLLTMLLVVKHGAGRLPPDRVSLYGRAVEVLLDTWNIQGHEPLNLKEAVPQLACVAFELMRAGKQTATESELLALLEEAREKVPQIRRYAKDTPQAFLKRVELRSSLLVEVGHQKEGLSTVPFYQFRHLTFQEYLSAVAAVEGHYLDYDKSHTILSPLGPYLTAEEWKEVIPMSAVLARKQAEPLMRSLVERGNQSRAKLEAGEDFAGHNEWLNPEAGLPGPVARIVQCLVEEAEAAPETLTSALQLAVLFARGCNSEYDWRALARGPYGTELLHQAWAIYSPMKWPHETWVAATCAKLATYHRWESYQELGARLAELPQLLVGDRAEDVGLGLLSCVGLLITAPERGLAAKALPISEVERHMLNPDPAIWMAAAWAWALAQHRTRPTIPPASAVLDRLLWLWLNAWDRDPMEIIAYALSTQLGWPQRAWRPELTEAQVNGVLERVESSGKDPLDREYAIAAACVVAFHSQKIWSEREVAERLRAVAGSGVLEMRDLSNRRQNAVSAILGKAPKRANRAMSKQPLDESAGHIPTVDSGV